MLDAIWSVDGEGDRSMVFQVATQGAFRHSAIVHWMANRFPQRHQTRNWRKTACYQTGLGREMALGMEPSLTQEFWDHVYHNRRDTVSWFQIKPQISLELISVAEIEKSDAIIDVGGGASTLVDRLIQGGYTDITVLDLSAQALKYTQTRVSEEDKKKISFLVADITKFDPRGKTYQLWHDRAVFHFLSDPADRIAYVHNLVRSLSPGGYLLIGTFAIGGVEQCSGMDIVQYNLEKMQSELGPRFSVVEERSEIHITPVGTQQPFWYGLFKFAEP